MEKKELIITDHAIVRYMERIMGVDLNEFKNQMITEDIKEFLIKNKYRSKGKLHFRSKGNEFVFQDNTLVTIIKRSR